MSKKYIKLGVYYFWLSVFLFFVLVKKIVVYNEWKKKKDKINCFYISYLDEYSFGMELV